MSVLTFPILFAAAWPGDLPATDAPAGLCELCGHRAPARAEWRPKSNWTAHATHAYPGEGAICVGCALLLNGGPEPDSRRRWTLYTLATNGERCAWALKDRRDDIARWVRDERWSVSVADQGKKHVAYMAPVASPGRVRVALDGRRVDVATPEWSALTAAIATARAAGVTKAALTAGLDHNAVRRLGVAAARAVEYTLAPHRNTAALDLAVLLDTTTKEGAS